MLNNLIRMNLTYKQITITLEYLIQTGSFKWNLGKLNREENPQRLQ